jgi:hypothetical protein
MRKLSFLLIAAGLLALGAAPAHAASAMPSQGLAASSDIFPVAEGCGWGRWRGPWGHCRDTPYHGPLPGGGYK